MLNRTTARLKESVVFLMTYSLVGVIGFTANAVSFALLLKGGVAVTFGTGIAFLIGGQVAFVCHDRFTFGNRVVDLDRWQQRWRRMMAGQMFGFLVNWTVANSLVQAGGIATWLVYLAATVCGAIVTCCWANYYSHKKGSNPDPAEYAQEHTHV